MFLLDTNIVSEMRRTRPHGAVLAWLADTDASDIYISAATVAEIQAGIERTREQDAAKALELERWLNEAILSMNVVAADAQTFRTWAALMHRRQGHLWADAMIAASAIQHSATVVTRNTKDFVEFGVSLINPFGAA
jgi:predicted nucleic acid-binding protein